LLQQSADTTLQSQLEKRLIETLSSISADEREQLRRDLRTEDTAYLEASAKPDDEAVRRFNNILNEVAGKMIALRAEIQPALIGGFRLRIGGHLWDASIAGQLEGAQVRRREVHGNV
jgi:F-type H+-transporting ATPase subunit delta